MNVGLRLCSGRHYEVPGPAHAPHRWWYSREGLGCNCEGLQQCENESATRGWEQSSQLSAIEWKLLSPPLWSLSFSGGSSLAAAGALGQARQACREGRGHKDHAVHHLPAHPHLCWVTLPRQAVSLCERQINPWRTRLCQMNLTQVQLQLESGHG